MKTISVMYFFFLLLFFFLHQLLVLYQRQSKDQFSRASIHHEDPDRKLFTKIQSNDKKNIENITLRRICQQNRGLHDVNAPNIMASRWLLIYLQRCTNNIFIWRSKEYKISRQYLINVGLLIVWATTTLKALKVFFDSEWSQHNS